MPPYSVRRAASTAFPGWPGSGVPTTWPGPLRSWPLRVPSTTASETPSRGISRIATGAPGWRSRPTSARATTRPRRGSGAADRPGCARARDPRATARTRRTRAPRPRTRAGPGARRSRREGIARRGRGRGRRGTRGHDRDRDRVVDRLGRLHRRGVGHQERLLLDRVRRAGRLPAGAPRREPAPPAPARDVARARDEREHREREHDREREMVARAGEVERGELRVRGGGRGRRRRLTGLFRAGARRPAGRGPDPSCHRRRRSWPPSDRARTEAVPSGPGENGTVLGTVVGVVVDVVDVVLSTGCGVSTAATLIVCAASALGSGAYPCGTRLLTLPDRVLEQLLDHARRRSCSRTTTGTSCGRPW